MSKQIKVSKEQKRILIEYIKKKTGMHERKLSNALTNKEINSMWVDLTNILNREQGAIKTVEQWKRCWADMKKNTKTKLSNEKIYICKTGGGPSNAVQLSQEEDEIARLINPSTIMGISGLRELEVNLHLEDHPNQVNKYELSEFDEQKENDDGDELDKENEIITFMVEDAPVEDPVQTEEKPTTFKKKLNKTARLERSIEISKDFVKVSEERKELQKDYQEKKISALNERNKILKRQNAILFEKNIILSQRNNVLENIAHSLGKMASSFEKK